MTGSPDENAHPARRSWSIHKAELVVETALAYAYGEQHRVSHISHAENRLLAAVSALIRRPMVTAPSCHAAAEAPKADEPTIEGIQLAVLEAQERAPAEEVQVVVMKLGGVADGNPSLKQLPTSQYRATIAALEVLPARSRRRAR